MAPVFEAFFDYGGPWIVILGVLSWIAFAPLSQIEDETQRWVAALSTRWLMKTAVGIALLAWAWSFGRLFLGLAYLRGAGALKELSTLLLVLVLALAGWAWKSISWYRVRRFQPWITHGIVVALIVCSGGLLADAPPGDLSQTTHDDSQRPVIAFVQGRLVSLGCFEAARIAKPREGSFDALTALAVISFQSANGLLENPQVDSKPGEVSSPEFRLLARPFPFLLGPERCPPPPDSSARRP